MHDPPADDAPANTAGILSGRAGQQSFGVLGRAVGYVIAAAAVATLLYVMVPGLRLGP